MSTGKPIKSSRQDSVVQPRSFREVAGEEHADLRLDVYLAEQIEDASRSFVQKLIRSGQVRIDGRVCKRPARTVAAGEEVYVELPPPQRIDLDPEPIPIDIIYQDPELVVVNKPSGLVVHPAPGHHSGTLLNAILHHCPDFQRPGEDPLRPGVVHRLDRYTSGLLVVAKTPRALACLAEQAREHRFDRRYLALVQGEFPENAGRITAPVGRSLTDRKRMAVTGLRGREAATQFEVLERYGIASLLALRLETGRTHQIRVHLRFAGRLILGDPVYGVADYSRWLVAERVREALERLQGQALHAERLGFVHPATGAQMVFTAPVPPHFQGALNALRTLCARDSLE